jgi:hypothetical protein
MKILPIISMLDPNTSVTTASSHTRLWCASCRHTGDPVADLPSSLQVGHQITGHQD